MRLFLERYITAEQLLKRWVGCRDFELAHMIGTENHETGEISPGTGVLTGYMVLDVKQTPSGFGCSVTKSPVLRFYVGGERGWRRIEYDWEGGVTSLQRDPDGPMYPIVFDMEEVEKLETTRPDLLYPFASLEELEKSSLSDPLPQALVEENAKLKARVQELEAEVQELRAAQPKTANAGLEAVAANRAKDWAGYLRIAVKVAVECVQAGETGVIREDFRQRCARKMMDTFGREVVESRFIGDRGEIRFPDTALDALREALPGEYRKGPGTPSQDE